MVAVNKVILVGPCYNMKSIPTKTGKPMLAFTLKTWKPMGKNEDGSKKDDKVSWHNIVAYAGAAEVLERYLTKGKIIYVEGVLDYREDNNGVKHTQIIVESFSFVGDSNQEQAG